MRGYWSCNRPPSLERTQALEDLPLVCHETLWCFGVLLSPEECRLWPGQATNLVCWFTRQASARLSSQLLDRWEEENHKLSARLGSGTRCCLRKHRAQDSTSSITKSRTQFPRVLIAQFPVSRSSWEAKGNPSPDTLARQLTDSALADSWWGPCSAQHSEPPSYRWETVRLTLPRGFGRAASVSTDTRCHSPSSTRRSSTFSLYRFSGCTKERLKEVIEECQLHRNKFHGDIIEYLLQEKKKRGSRTKARVWGSLKSHQRIFQNTHCHPKLPSLQWLFSESENNGALVRGFPEI